MAAALLTALGAEGFVSEATLDAADTRASAKGCTITNAKAGDGTLTLATSDVVQAGHQFVAPRQWAPPVIAATSQLAQVALLIGLLR